jgi:hypothetical protein
MRARREVRGLRTKQQVEEELALQNEQKSHLAQIALPKTTDEEDRPMTAGEVPMGSSTKRAAKPRADKDDDDDNDDDDDDDDDEEEEEEEGEEEDYRHVKGKQISIFTATARNDIPLLRWVEPNRDARERSG